MNVVSIVANLQKSHDWCKEQLEEARAVIKQLTEGPGEIEYIHPLDVCEMLDSFKLEECVDVFVLGKKNSNIIEFAKSGKKYKPSVLIPAKTKKYA